MQEYDPVRMQSEFLGDARFQGLHGLPPGDGQLHRAAGRGGDAQTHGGLAAGDPGPAACTLEGGDATETPLLLLHSRTLAALNSGSGRWDDLKRRAAGLLCSGRHCSSM